jgi:hypothetical protein
MNYNNKVFRGRTNSAGGEVGAQTIFFYYQDGDRLTGTYSGGAIVHGHLIGKVLPDGRLEFLYHHVNRAGELMAGQCNSTPCEGAHGKLILKEKWQWLTGDRSTGQSEVEEV